MKSNVIVVYELIELSRILPLNPSTIQSKKYSSSLVQIDLYFSCYYKALIYCSFLNLAMPILIKNRFNIYLYPTTIILLGFLFLLIVDIYIYRNHQPSYSNTTSLLPLFEKKTYLPQQLQLVAPRIKLEDIPPKITVYQKATQGGSRVIGMIMDNGISRRRHTRVFGNGPCKACNKDESGNKVKLGNIVSSLNDGTGNARSTGA